MVNTAIAETAFKLEYSEPWPTESPATAIYHGSSLWEMSDIVFVFYWKKNINALCKRKDFDKDLIY